MAGGGRTSCTSFPLCWGGRRPHRPIGIGKDGGHGGWLVLGLERWRCGLLGYKKQKRRRQKSCLWTKLIHRGEEGTKSGYKKRQKMYKKFLPVDWAFILRINLCMNWGVSAVLLPELHCSHFMGSIIPLMTPLLLI